jgi:hypothetical protein
MTSPGAENQNGQGDRFTATSPMYAKQASAAVNATMRKR